MTKLRFFCIRANFSCIIFSFYFIFPNESYVNSAKFTKKVVSLSLEKVIAKKEEGWNFYIY